MAGDEQRGDRLRRRRSSSSSSPLDSSRSAYVKGSTGPVAQANPNADVIRLHPLGQVSPLDFSPSLPNLQLILSPQVPRGAQVLFLHPLLGVRSPLPLFPRSS